ncbi:3-hydroxyacyl-ACP dehydratase FabZ family protein [Lentibacillus cibarius]|uniref:Beta-hydroxyacyl-ACP dehydratase n=1 Tax=Lentibacillus cibarius TaxID=2583219 RepID=A0A5S3QG53_9BACI|nr:3-hydroxyacyl-ACP dehydratase FabZ family protein [Lentibacillus cibarius]TMN20875.1 beta-hydroxyacyl-ACP dehydratase [Lentibacillus cibarius]
MKTVTKKKPHELLKQSPPFLFVDRVDEIDDQRIVCTKHLSYNEPFFAGHFPGNPIAPGVLLIEMAAQASLIIAGALEDTQQPQLGYLVETKKFRFYNQAIPGDTLKIEVELKDSLGNYRTAKARITEGDKMITKGELVFYVPKEGETLDTKSQ